MKKLFFTLSVIVFSAVGVFAQGVSGGLKAGVNLSNLKYEGNIFTANADGRTGFHAGGYVNVAFSESFSLQPELLYNSTGAKLSNTDFKTDYVSIPVMFKFNPIPVFNFHFGPQFGFLTSAKLDGNDIKEDYKGLDFGVGAGLGLDFLMGLSLSARYVLGLSNIYENTGGDAKVTSSAFQISASFRLFGT